MMGWSGWPTSPLKSTLDLLPLFLELQLEEGRAQDVPGIVEHGGHAGGRAGPALNTPPA